MKCQLLIVVLALAAGVQARGQNIEVDARVERKSATTDEPCLREVGDRYEKYGKGARYLGEGYKYFQQSEAQRLDNFLRWEAATREARASAVLNGRGREIDKIPPRRLTEKSLTADGMINWPRPLLSPEYAPWRRQLENLFRKRGEVAEADLPQFLSDVQSLCGVMGTGLDAHVLQLSRPIYLQSARFLRNLAHEASFAAQ
jgi:hypothetical protein